MFHFESELLVALFDSTPLAAIQPDHRSKSPSINRSVNIMDCIRFIVLVQSAQLFYVGSGIKHREYSSVCSVVVAYLWVVYLYLLWSVVTYPIYIVCGGLT
ncbi:hypothetical protein NQ317_000555 [Molorchus minor]|uniref:Uncharacterized protein n=1 Tax=Molorchus minor TaxID=1323400 RepID=A0ABQ9JT32_9CUCU|nr:hypothetical protein NQ317_000555 [Molorchus minor]